MQDTILIIFFVVLFVGLMVAALFAEKKAVAHKKLPKLEQLKIEKKYCLSNLIFGVVVSVAICLALLLLKLLQITEINLLEMLLRISAPIFIFASVYFTFEYIKSVRRLKDYINNDNINDINKNSED